MPVLLRPSSRTDDAQPEIVVSLPHPSNGAMARFLVEGGSGRMCEIIRIADPRRPRSSLLNMEHVLADGSIVCCTPIDPVFLVLPCLLHPAVSGRFVETYDILEEFETANAPHGGIVRSHMTSVLESAIKRVCDTPPGVDDGLFRLSHARLFALLDAKAARVSRQLPASLYRQYVENLVAGDVHTGALAPDENTVHAEIIAQACLRCARQLVASYLPEALRAEYMADKRYELYEQRVADISRARTASTAFTNSTSSYINSATKRKSEGEMAAGKRKPTAVKTTTTRGQKSLAKASTTGMKTMMSYFGKK